MISIKLDEAQLMKSAEQAVKELSESMMKTAVQRTVNEYFRTAVPEFERKAGEGLVIIEDAVVNYLLSQDLKTKVEKTTESLMPKAIYEAVVKATEHQVKKAAFTSVKELAEKDPEALLNFIRQYKNT